MPTYTCAEALSNYSLNRWNDGSLHIYPCCPYWVNEIQETYSGSVLGNGIIREFKEKALKGDLSYCNTGRCPYLIKNDKSSYPFIEVGSKEYEHVKAQVRVQLSTDNACNLSCPSCRNNLITQPSEGAEQAFQEVLKQATQISLMGSGEALALPYVISFLRTFSKQENPQLNEIALMTNGLLFTQVQYEKFSQDTKDILKTVCVSVDANTEGTYQKVRRGGSFSRLCDNLLFISELKARGFIREFQMNFVVQEANYLELYDFVQGCHDLGATCNIQDIEDWGIPVAFKKVTNMEHQAYPLFKKVYLKAIELAETLHLPYKTSVVIK